MGVVNATSVLVSLCGGLSVGRASHNANAVVQWKSLDRRPETVRLNNRVVC